MTAAINPQYEPADILRGLYGDGIIGCPGAFPAAFADAMRSEIETLFAEAQTVPGGALPRGPQRWYVEVQPERLSGFVEITTHPWFVAVCEAALGPDYRIVEVGFEIPFPGAADQPWHRDFAVPEATTRGRRLNSLAFNVTAVDTRDEHGPFEIAPGTLWDQFEGCAKGMFPPREWWPRYEARGQEISQAGRHLGAVGADRPPRHRQPLDPSAAGAGRRRRCPRRHQCAPSRPAGDARLS
jgi:hypothetical protein